MNKAAQAIKEWREKPLKFVWDNFKVELDKWQAEAVEKFGSPDPKIRLSLQACVGPGKTMVEAICGWWFLSTQGEPGNHPKGAAVSITSDNLKDNLWPEFSKWQSRSPFLMKAFEWTKERIFAKDHPETWFLSARSWSKNADPEEQGRTLSGLHSKYVLVLIDESGEIPLSVLKAGEQSFSETGCQIGRIMQAGNPTSLNGMLYAAATKFRKLWHVIRITGDPEDSKRSPRIDVDWAKQQIALYGRENPWVMATILGQFPPSSLNALLGVEEVEAAMNRKLKQVHFEFAQKRLGVDVAREGDDRTVLFPRQGLLAFEPVIMRNQNGPQVASRIALAKDRWNWETCFVDDTGGFGGSVIDSMLQGNISNIPVNFSGKADDPRYLNRRAEMWFRMAQWIKRGGALPNIPELIPELTTPTYSFVNGKFALEDKKLIKGRMGKSPDLADALALTFAWAEMPRGFNADGGTLPSHELLGLGLDKMPEMDKRGLKSDFDPFRELANV